MSLATWKKDHYPIPACRCVDGKELQFDRQKWIGLLPANRKKHGLRLISRKQVIGLILTDGKKVFVINGGSCASCHKQPIGAGSVRSACGDCLLKRCYGNWGTPWGRFITHKAIRPMIDHIEKAIKKQERGCS